MSDHDQFINSRTGEVLKVTAVSGSLWFVAKVDMSCEKCGTRVMAGTDHRCSWRS